MNFREVVKYCPRCGGDSFPEKSRNFFRCDRCDFHFHINASTAVAGIITDDAGRILLIRRGKDPGKGKWSVPGGFVDADESAEAALEREMREEVNLEIARFEFLCSWPNAYSYKGVVYPVVDLIFVCTARSLDPLNASEEVDGYTFFAPEAVDLETIAFPSIRHALELFRNQKKA